MLKSQDLSLKLSATKQKLNVLNALETRSEEQTNEMDELTQTALRHEIEYRSAVVCEDAALDDAKGMFGGDGEAAEIRQLRGKATLQNYVIAALENRAATGVEAEFNAALGIVQGNRFPLILLAGKEPERRATSDTDTAVDAMPWLDRLFAETAAAYLGIGFESVSPGVANYPITTAGGTPAQRARTQDAVSAPWRVSVTELKPARCAVHLEYSKEDDLRIPMLEESLIRDLRMALIERIDRSVFLGDDTATGTDADVVGLDTAAGVSEQTLTQAFKVRPDKTVQAFTGLVDGIHATDLSDLKIVASEGSFQLWTGHVLDVSGETASVFKTLAQFLNESRVMWQTRELEPATTADKFGAFVSRARGLTGAARAPMWRSAELISDPYSKAKSGEVLLTLTAFWNFGLPRASNFARLKYVT